MELSVPVLRAGSVLARRTPPPLARPVIGLMSRAFVAAAGDQVTMAERNMRRVLGDDLSDAAARRGAQRVVDSYARYWFDTLRLPTLSVEQVAAGFRVAGIEHLEAALDAGGGAILALPHLGGWEWAGRWLSDVRGWKVTAVAEDLEPAELAEWFLQLRHDLGMDIVTLGPSAAAGVGAALSANHVVCLLADRDISGAGIEVEFFGETTRLPGGPALMALRSGAPLLPTAVYFEDGICRGVVEPPLDTTRHGRLREDVHRVTQDLAHVLERQVRRAPDQWHLLQPNWPSDFRALGLPVPGEAP